MILEICASTYQSAINAQESGAHRIELCENLSVGGVTPSHSLIKKTIEALNIPVFVLVRPRDGDFVYSKEEFNQMKSAINFCKTSGCHGIVSGILKPDQTIDLKRTAELIQYSKPLPFTFHKAFDDVLNAKEALTQLIDLGCNRILTSGQANTATEGFQHLKELKNIANGKLTILVGGSVRSDNASQFKDAGFKEIHSSAVLLGKHSDLEEIKKLSEIVSG